jgi:iron(III) transport system ATP-binding protein
VGVLERGRLVQQGTPEEIYTQPETPFVARFTGLSGELPVRVRGRAADGTVEVELAGPAQARPFQARGPSLPIGEAAALLMVRPTGVQLCASQADEHHIAGTVADVAFRGRGYEHAIDIPGHGRLTSVFSDTRAERGEHVGLRLDPRGCHLFSAGPGEAAQPVSAGLDPVTAGP